MDVRISTVIIENFRGVLGKLTIDLDSAFSNKPKSMILFGDNGTGKSSIVDAIQFALQGEIGKNRKIQSVRSLFNSSLPSVLVRLSNGREIRRNLFLAENEKLKISNSNRDENFYIAPFVLRRSDILRFLNAPDVKRQVVFFEYRFTRDNIEKAVQEKINIIEYKNKTDLQVELQEKKIEAKNKRRKLINELAKIISIPVKDVPLDNKRFTYFVHEKVYSGLNKKQRSQLSQLKKGDFGYVDPVVYNLTKRINEINIEISKINKEKKKVLKNEIELAKKLMIQDLILKAGTRITESFKNISNCDFIDEIKLICGDISEVSLTVRIDLKNGNTCSPNQIFSEANLDLLVLLIFLSLVKESAGKGQAKFLILDDVFQSVDSTIRVSLVDYILKEFSDWQLIFTVHDRLWRSQLANLLLRNRHSFTESEILKWNSSYGLTIFNTSKDIDYFLLESIESGQIINICSQAGLLLEEVCNKLSWILPISVIRRKEDKYTLGDLWPGIYKTLKKTNMKNSVNEIDKWLHLRNLVGAHYNEWARSVSLQEARSFAEAVLQLFWNVRCSSCFRWIEPLGSQGKHWACRCKKLNVFNP